MRAFVLMGVSGSGKSTIGIHAAARLAWPYLEGDDFQPPENIGKMPPGMPLCDADRVPWIESLSRAINRQTRPCVIVACSALTRFVRNHLEDSVQRPISFIHLRASLDTLQCRLRVRYHVVRDDTLSNQLQVLELPSEGAEIDADDGIDVVTARVVSRMLLLAGILRPHP